MITILCSILVIVVIAYLFQKRKDPEPIFGIYNQPGKWYPIKFTFFLFLLHFRRWSSAKSQKSVKDAGYGAKSHNDPEQMDVAQPLSDHPKAFDATFFIAANKDGFYIATGCERRQMGIINGLFYLIIPGKGILCSPKLPDTLLFGAKINEFGAEGIRFTPEEPMKKWRVSYNGKMYYKSDPKKIVNVTFEGEWLASSEYFDYDTDLNAFALTRGIARESWSRQYFEGLKSSHQSHYEQFGNMKAHFNIDNEEFDIEMDSFRDHSYGHKRDWELMHRYAFHQIFLANGHRLVVGVVCQPCTSSLLEIGFVWSPENGNQAIEWCDLELYQHGENGKAPTDYAFQLKAGGEVYTIQVDVQYESEHFVSSHWDARMVERFAKYSVNGIDGWGVTEFHYNYKEGRPEDLKKNDPDWFQMLRD